MDLRKFDSITNADKGVELVLEEGKDGKSLAGIFLLGADSAACKEKAREIDRRNAEKHGKPSAQEMENQTFERIVACTKGWHGLEEDGKDLPFSAAEAEKLYRKYPELAERVTQFIFTRGNFFPTALTN